MSLAGARGIVRASRIPTCARQAAMVVEHVKELEFYRSLVGDEFRGEYGERVSAHRRGAAFERAAFDNDAAQLKAALAPRFGYRPEDMWVRNFAEEIPGPPTTMRGGSGSGAGRAGEGRDRASERTRKAARRAQREARRLNRGREKR